MKSAIISASILLTIIILLAINAVVLDRCAQSLLETVHNMSDDPIKEYENACELFEKWDKMESYVSISVVHAETEAVTHAVSLIRVYSKTNNASEFMAAKRIFEHAVMHISFSGAISLETIL